MRTGASLVFEIGTEELPPAAAWDGARQLRERAADALAAARLPVSDLRSYSTPRRLVLMAHGVAARQGDLVRETRGPAVRVAFSADGRPTQAAEGFARAQGVRPEELERRSTPQGEYVFAVRREPGEPAAGVLARLLPDLAAGLVFPKPMRWGAGTVRFARPVRWILALLDRRVIACEFAGVRAGRRTFGHRTFTPDAVAETPRAARSGPKTSRARRAPRTDVAVVPSAEDYERILRGRGVVLDPEERRARIAEGAARTAGEVGGRPLLDQGLLDETVQLVEWPEAFVGRFAEAFLDLPRDVLITVMQHHQKYFAVEDSAGRLLPAFVAIRNGDRRGLDTVREGNEWVLRARLADARFFFDDDRRRSLASRVQDLSGLVFLQELGTMAEKTRRLERLAERLSRTLSLAPEVAAHLRRAAHLSKADLVTQMVRELPELQGTIGGIYARLDGEPEPVAEAIQEQYLPRGPRMPRSTVGAYLALLDKADTLLGAFAAGLAASGSQDPYGLRRAAQGIIVIVLDRGLHLSIRDLAASALDAGGIDDPGRRERTLAAAADLLAQRLRTTLVDEGIAYDTVDAALASGADDLVDAASRARALAAFRERSEFADLYRAYDRAARILPRDFSGEIREEVITSAAERELLEAVRRLRAPAIGGEPEPPHDGIHPQHAGSGSMGMIRLGSATPGDAADGGAKTTPEALVAYYTHALERLTTLAGPVDRFFTDVLVMDPDDGVRASRLALLAAVVALIRPIADLSRVVVGEGKPVATS
jgi:glycyl-tRNA synthetase beta chain